MGFYTWGRYCDVFVFGWLLLEHLWCPWSPGSCTFKCAITVAKAVRSQRVLFTWSTWNYWWRYLVTKDSQLQPRAVASVSLFCLNWFNCSCPVVDYGTVLAVVMPFQPCSALLCSSLAPPRVRQGGFVYASKKSWLWGGELATVWKGLLPPPTIPL